MNSHKLKSSIILILVAFFVCCVSNVSADIYGFPVEVINIRIESSTNRAYFVIDNAILIQGTQNGNPCQTLFSIDLSNDFGKNMYAMLLTAKTSGNKITFNTSIANTCNTWGADVRDIVLH